MSICAVESWRMDLLKYGSRDPVTFKFRDVRVDNEDITGRVYDSNDHFVSELNGTCSPFDHRENVARMLFLFTVPGADIVLLGLGSLDRNSTPIFRGGFVALAPTSQTASTSQTRSAVPVIFDPGDTGTGTGMQAQ